MRKKSKIYLLNIEQNMVGIYNNIHGHKTERGVSNSADGMVDINYYQYTIHTEMREPPSPLYDSIAVH